ncbi:hypothetical protein AMAG_05184 [Allomyces macrogynus ATCC 38327]|uniref:Uncharacterized protein n=1 Tax=Allomyces macrogynus (strain ATCC 38327) TaxID=578462 RepID=A0A0L0SBE8_ALLM3|nr:hypothetical protein AMAG_05184 [Allomyces macrogynus ATCC 38327]|eukprot:KNE59720.1 hypothetical protein AMAG_05184 [Allomyces macrogynus ATCC 38327]
MCGTITQRVLVARGALMGIIAAAVAIDLLAWIVLSASPRTDVPVAVIHRVTDVAMITAGNLVTAKHMRMLVDPKVRAKWGLPWTWVVGVTVVLAILWLAAGVLRIAQAAVASNAFWRDAALPEWTDAVALAVPIGGPLVIVAGAFTTIFASWKHQRTKLQPMLDNSGGTGSASPPAGPSTLLLFRLAHAVSVSLTASFISSATFASRLTLSGRSALSLGGGRLDSSSRGAPAVHVQATSTESNLKPTPVQSTAGSVTASGAFPRGAPTLALPGTSAPLPRAVSSPGTLATAPRPTAPPSALDPPGPTPPPQGLAPDAPTAGRSGMVRSGSRGMVRSNSRGSNSRGMVRSGSSTSTSSHQSRRSRASTAGSHVTATSAATSAASGRSDASVGRLRGATGDRIAPITPATPPESQTAGWSLSLLVLAVHFTQAILWAVVLAVSLAVRVPAVAGVVADAAVTVFVALDMRFYGTIWQRVRAAAKAKRRAKRRERREGKYKRQMEAAARASALVIRVSQVLSVQEGQMGTGLGVERVVR